MVTPDGREPTLATKPQPDSGGDREVVHQQDPTAALPAPDIQKAVVEAAAETIPYQRKIFRAADDKIVERLKKKGVITGVATSEPFEKAARTVWVKFADDFGGMGTIERVLATR